MPYKYRAKNFVNAMQWAIGLEIMLLAEDLWRVLFSTDHPNGALFVRYPEIIHLLMDKDERAGQLDRVPQEARDLSNLPGIARELTLSEIAIVTRAGPARRLGLADRGHLGAGAVADVAVYTDQADKTAMFGSADLVFKNGRLVVKDGEVVDISWGQAFQVTPGFDVAIERKLAHFYDRYYGVNPSSFGVPASIAARPDRFQTVPANLNLQPSRLSRPSPRPFPWASCGDHHRADLGMGPHRRAQHDRLCHLGDRLQAEAGIERILKPAETLDGRPGVAGALRLPWRPASCRSSSSIGSVNAS